MANNKLEISPIYLDMPFPVSKWVVSQWCHSSYMQGDRMTRNDPRSRDPQWGLANRRVLVHFENEMARLLGILGQGEASNALWAIAHRLPKAWQRLLAKLPAQ